MSATKYVQMTSADDLLSDRVFLTCTLQYQVILLIADVELIDKSHLRAIKK